MFVIHGYDFARFCVSDNESILFSKGDLLDPNGLGRFPFIKDFFLFHCWIAMSVLKYFQYKGDKKYLANENKKTFYKNLSTTFIFVPTESIVPDKRKKDGPELRAVHELIDVDGNKMLLPVFYTDTYYLRKKCGSDQKYIQYSLKGLLSTEELQQYVIRIGDFDAVFDIDELNFRN